MHTLSLRRLLGNSFLTANCCLSQGQDSLTECSPVSVGKFWAVRDVSMGYGGLGPREDLGLPAGHGYMDSEHPFFSDHQLALCPDEP